MPLIVNRGRETPARAGELLRARLIDLENDLLSLRTRAAGAGLSVRALADAALSLLAYRDELTALADTPGAAAYMVRAFRDGAGNPNANVPFQADLQQLLGPAGALQLLLNRIATDVPKSPEGWVHEWRFAGGARQENTLNAAALAGIIERLDAVLALLQG